MKYFSFWKANLFCLYKNAEKWSQVLFITYSMCAWSWSLLFSLFVLCTHPWNSLEIVISHIIFHQILNILQHLAWPWVRMLLFVCKASSNCFMVFSKINQIQKCFVYWTRKYCFMCTCCESKIKVTVHKAELFSEMILIY